MPLSLDDVITAIASNNPSEIERVFNEAKSEKNWALVKLFCDMGDSNPHKPSSAQKERLIDEARAEAIAGNLSRWQDVFDIERAFVGEGAHHLKAGPLPRSIHTIELEAFVRELISPNGAHFEITHEGGDDMYTFHGSGHRYNWSQLRQHANFQHLLFNEQDFSEYRAYKSARKLPEPFNYTFTSDLVPNKLDQYLNQLYRAYDEQNLPRPERLLRFEEMETISCYTGNDYQIMNPMLRGEIHDTTWTYFRLGGAPIPYEVIRAAIIDSVICCHALGQLPVTTVQDTYRGKGSAPADLEFYIRGAANQMVMSFVGFTSTSLSEHVGGQYSNLHGMILHFTDLKGVNVAPLSQMAHEAEFLIPPTEVQLKAYFFDENYLGMLGPAHVVHLSTVSDLAYLERFNPNSLTMPLVDELDLSSPSSVFDEVDRELKKGDASEKLASKLEQHGLFSSDESKSQGALPEGLSSSPNDKNIEAP